MDNSKHHPNAFKRRIGHSLSAVSRSKHLSKFGLIDLGSNGLRLHLYELDNFSRVKKLLRKKQVLHLGREVFFSGFLSDSAYSSTKDIVADFLAIAQDYGVERILGAATSASRSAINADIFIRRLSRDTSVPFTLLSGAREAQLITKAVLSSEAAIPDAIIDVGGGSTEISILNPSKEPLPLSFEIGVARTTKLLYPKENQAACSKGVVLLRQRLRETLYPFLNSHAVRSRRSLLATSGSLFALLRYSNAAGETLRKDQVHEITVALEGISLRKIENSLPLKDSWRAATLLASSLIADECIRALSTEMIHFRRHSLADGLACEIAQESKETGIGSSRRELKGL